MFSSPSQQSQFSFTIFSIFTQLIQLSQQRIAQNLTQSINQLEEQFTKTSHSKYDQALFNFLKQKALSVNGQSSENKDTPSISQSFKTFLQTFSQSKVRISNQDNISQNIDQCKFIIADKRRLYSLKQQIVKKQQKQKQKSITITQYKPPQQQNTDQLSYRAFVIYGKAINVQKHKKGSSSTNQSTSQQGQQSPPNISNQDFSIRTQSISNLEYCMTHLYQQQKLPYIKSEPHQLEDIILTHYMEDSSIIPILVANEVYRLFYPIEDALILLIPQDLIDPTKPQIPSIIKNTVLHVYMDNYKVFCKIISKEQFFKNTNFRGIYFVQEGEVQTKSGRVVARGWVINGKCKSTTQVCKFNKIMAFFKYVLENQNVWKQFVNDLKLNGEWPIKISDVLGLDQKTFDQMMGEQAATFKLNSGNQRQKRLKFPPISSRLSKSFDLQKLTEIEKMKHFNQKINHLHQFKQQMLKRKIQMGSKRNSLHIESQVSEQASQRQINKRIQILSQKMNLPQKGIKTDVSRSLILRPGQSSANILVTGIVKKLKSIHEGSSRNSMEKSIHGESKKQLVQISRSKTKILGLKRYDEILKNQKFHLFKGKNFYN